MSHRSSWGVPIWPPSLFKRRGLCPPRTPPASARTRPGTAVARLGFDTGCLIDRRGGPRYGPPASSSEGGYAPLGLPRPSLGRAPAQPWRASGLTQDVSSRSAVGQRVELPGERRALGDRQLARVIPADVGRRLAVVGRAALEQRHAGRSLATAAHHA